MEFRTSPRPLEVLELLLPDMYIKTAQPQGGGGRGVWGLGESSPLPPGQPRMDVLMKTHGQEDMGRQAT